MTYFGSQGSFYAARTAAEAGAAARRSERQAEGLEERFERSMLTLEAMWTLLRDKLGLTDEDLCNRMTDLDLSDGRLDGKHRHEPRSCPNCGKAIGPRFSKCIYCGQLVEETPFA